LERRAQHMVGRQDPQTHKTTKEYTYSVDYSSPSLKDHISSLKDQNCFLTQDSRLRNS
jgi:hypothetical protein